jgi:hypothetical protein
MEEGLALGLAWEPGPFILESDSTDALMLAKEGTLNLSRHPMRIKLIRDRIREREVGLQKVSRDANGGLALLGRVHERSGV